MAAKYAKIAQPKYGNEDPVYLQVIVNDFLNKKEYANAKEYLESLLALDSQNATVIDLIGVTVRAD